MLCRMSHIPPQVSENIKPLLEIVRFTFPVVSGCVERLMVSELLIDIIELVHKFGFLIRDT